MIKYTIQPLLTIILAISLHISFCQSQVYFSKDFCPEQVATIAANVLLSDSGYIIAGSYRDSLNHHLKLHLMQIDFTGNIKQISTFGNDTVGYYPGFCGSIIQVNDSDLFWVCGKSNTLRDYSALMKTNTNLNVEWEKDYLFNNDSTYSFLLLANVISTDDSGFAMVGALNSNHYTTDLLLQKTDSMGNVQWRKQFVYYGVTIGWSVIQTPDHGFLVGGGAYTPYVKHTYQGLIIKTDSLGNEQWHRYPGSPDYDDSYCIVRNSPDGNYIVGTLLGVGQYYNSWYDFTKIRLLKLSNSGSVLWDKTYGGEKLSSTTTQVYVNSNGDIVTCGFYYPGFTDSVDTWGWILKTNNNGDSLWLREHYRYNGYLNTNRLNDLKPTPDGGYILVGQTDSFTYIPQSAWVLKVDSLGCAVSGCQYVGMKELIIKNEELEMYPNPASEVVNLKLPAFINQEVLEIRIFNQLGQEVLRHAVAPETPLLTIPVHTLPPGTYYVRAITRYMSVTTTKKLIISR